MAYGARLESALSESSRGFESPILRRNDNDPLWVVFHFWGWGMRTGFAGAPSASRSGDFGGPFSALPHQAARVNSWIQSNFFLPFT